MSLDKIHGKSQTQIEILAAHVKRPDSTPLKDKALQFKLRRMVKADEFLYQYKRIRSTVDALIEFFEVDGKKYSRATAYLDVKDAKLLFGSLNQPNKKYDRIMLADWQKEMMLIAAEKRDFKAFNMGMNNLIKILGLDKEDIERPNYEDLQPVPVELGFFPDQMSKNVPPEEELDAWIDRMKQTKKTKAQTIFIKPVDEATDKV